MAISPQLGKYSKQVVKKNHLTFSVLCDTGNRLASQFGMVFSLPDDLREIYSKFGINLARFNGDNSWTLALPGRFILDRQGLILSADVNHDYTKRPEPADIIEVLKKL